MGAYYAQGDDKYMQGCVQWKTDILVIEVLKYRCQEKKLFRIWTA
jgi:hypothetical protein